MRTDRDDDVALIVRGDLDLPTEGQLLAAACGSRGSGVDALSCLTCPGCDSSRRSGFEAGHCHEAATSGQEMRVVTGSNRRVHRLLKSCEPLAIFDSVASVLIVISSNRAGSGRHRGVLVHPPERSQR